ncbi:MAG TPA: hypothetical protein VIJ61_02650 [Thermoanaerobaculia bacterium]
MFLVDVRQGREAVRRRRPNVSDEELETIKKMADPQAKLFEDVQLHVLDPRGEPDDDPGYEGLPAVL